MRQCILPCIIYLICYLCLTGAARPLGTTQVIGNFLAIIQSSINLPAALEFFSLNDDILLDSCSKFHQIPYAEYQGKVISYILYMSYKPTILCKSIISHLYINIRVVK